LRQSMTSDAVAEERTGEAYEFDEQLTAIGPKLRAGTQAPEFTLDTFDLESQTVRPVRLSDATGSVRLLNVVNSLDTPVCNIETRRWDSLAEDLPPGVVVQTISMDLPWAQARWRESEGVRHEALSGHRDEAFGRDYGVLLKEWRLLQRAVFVIDPDNRIAYAEYVNDQMAEPDYDAAVQAAKRAAGT
jgi:thioredoxin-dependent peroxiredoxin